jgi:hypothetical protein
MSALICKESWAQDVIFEFFRTPMKVREILFHTIPCLFGFLPHLEAIAETPDCGIKNRVIPWQFCDITIS